MNRVILFGAPGAGKGTQADFIEQNFGYKKISTGDLIRTEVRSGSEIGKIVKAIIDNGELVSDEIIIEMVKRRINQDDIKKGYIMDGFPRTLKQALELSNIKIEREIVIYLKVNEDSVVERLVSRLTCKKCEAIYNIKDKPPKNPEICDVCGGILERRMDDNEETIRNRIKVYNETTLPVIDFYREKGILYEVDASDSIDEVSLKIEGILK